MNFTTSQKKIKFRKLISHAKWLNLGSVIGILFLISCGNDKNETDKNITTTNPPQINKAHVEPPAFNADSAYFFVKTQCDFGPRNPGSKAHEKCASWIENQLKSYGANVIVQQTTLTTYDQKKWLCKNIIGEFNPDAKERIILMAHWDSRPIAEHETEPAERNKPILGANDGASGVGVLLEVARAIAQKKPEIGIDILFNDLEDYGDPEGNVADSWCLGTQYWSKNPHRPQYYAKYGILLDMVGAKGAVFPREGTSVDFARSIVDKVWAKAKQMGFGNYFIDLQTQATTDDHLYVNSNTSIPTIDIVHYDTQSRSYFPCHHKQCDDMSQIDKKTLEVVGKLLLELIYNE
jgi:Peptidase family M28